LGSETSSLKTASSTGESIANLSSDPSGVVGTGTPLTACPLSLRSFRKTSPPAPPLFVLGGAVGIFTGGCSLPSQKG
jgi:hypothetical protein